MPVIEERMHTRDFVELENEFGAHNYIRLTLSSSAPREFGSVMSMASVISIV